MLGVAEGIPHPQEVDVWVPARWETGHDVDIRDADSDLTESGAQAEPVAEGASATAESMADRPQL